MSSPTSQASAPALPGSASQEQNILKVAKGGGITFVGSLVEFGVRFFMGILIARFLGSEQFGLYTLVLTIVAVSAGLALLGLPSALVRYIALYAKRRDGSGIWGTLQVGVGVTTVLAVLMAIGLALLADPLARGLFHAPRLAPLLRWFSLLVPFLALVEIMAAATRGFGRMEPTAVAKSVSQPIIKLALVLCLALVGLNASRVLMAHFISVVVAFVIILIFLNRLFTLRRPLGSGRREPKELLKFSLPLHLDFMIVTFRGNIQTFLLGAFNTLATVGIFTVASQINMIGQMYHASIVTASMPIVSELYGQGERDRLAKFYQTMTKWTFTLNLPLFIIVLVFAEPILSIFGEDFVDGALALTILAFGSLVNTGTGICGVVINMTGNTGFNLINSVILTVVTIGLNLLLIPKWGLIGAAIATMVAAVGVNLLRLSEVYYLFRMFPYNASFLKPIIAGLVTLVAALGVRQLNMDNSLVGIVFSVAALLSTYLVMILILGLSQEDRLVLNRLYQRIRTLLPLKRF